MSDMNILFNNSNLIEFDCSHKKYIMMMIENH